MKVLITTLSALLIVGGVALPVCARDFEAQVPGFKTMKDEEQSKVIREITRQNKLKPGEDKIHIKDPNDGLGTKTWPCLGCWLDGSWSCFC